MIEPEKITIVEGPPPVFENAHESWALAIAEGVSVPHSVRCLVRTLDGLGLVERCQVAWAEGRDVYLEYRDRDGFQEQALIMAVRAGEVDEGEVLHVWLRFSRPLMDEDDAPDDDLA
ncbi:MAG: hypothetical protein ACE5FI_14440 [Anaerolineales bacterium]